MYNINIDIVIPIYNAYDDLVKCITSIKSNTDLISNRLILVNDKSSDKRIEEYISSLQSENIIIISNNENLGFSGTVNKGITYSDRDVILLNSDTIVTKGWVKKIINCAYADTNIGTVTPLSNNATTCSIPTFCEENIIPFGLSIDDYAAVVEECSFKRYPLIPVAVGFCMYIKREVINDIGLFDKETFQRGYGEENDFCFRAEQFGYKHVLCDDTFIFHSGTMSFHDKEKVKLIQDHEKILYERYPKQMNLNSQFCLRNPDQDIRDNVNIYAKLKNNRTNVVYVIHSDFHPNAQDNVGGTQLHVKDLTKEMSELYNVFVISRDGYYLRLTIYISNERSFEFKYYIGDSGMYYVFRDKDIANIICNIYNAFKINLVHIHHVKGLSLDFFYEAKKVNIPVILTLHDFFIICPRTKLLDNYNQICINEHLCETCLYHTLKMPQGNQYINKWRKEFSKALEICNQIIAPSSSTKQIYTKYYPYLEGKISVISHGIEQPFLAKSVKSIRIKETDRHKSYFDTCLERNNIIRGWAYLQDEDSDRHEIFLEVEDQNGHKEMLATQREERLDVVYSTGKQIYKNCGFWATLPLKHFCNGDIKFNTLIKCDEFYSKNSTEREIIRNFQKQEDKKIKVAFIGGLEIAKGSQLVASIITSLPQDKYEWFIFGGIGDWHLKSLEKKNLHKIGHYERNEIFNLLDQFEINLVCILSIWPETFCYTLSEALVSGVPVLVTNVGALSERVKNKELGWVIDLDNVVADIKNILYEISTRSERYDIICKNVESYTHKNVKQMVAEYQKIYELEINKRVYQYDSYSSIDIFKGFMLNQQMYYNNNSRADDYVNVLQNQLDAIESSLGYKMLNKFHVLPLPVKNFLKKLCIKLIIRKG